MTLDEAIKYRYQDIRTRVPIEANSVRLDIDYTMWMYHVNEYYSEPRAYRDFDLEATVALTEENDLVLDEVNTTLIDNRSDIATQRIFRRFPIEPAITMDVVIKAHLNESSVHRKSFMNLNPNMEV